ncbi:unnamed protein product, partial [marine sediment metagenome]
QCKIAVQNKNHYILKHKKCNDKFGLYNFHLINGGGIYKLNIGDTICFKCQENIEVLKCQNDVMIDILNKNMNKNSFKFSEFLDAKKKFFKVV